METHVLLNPWNTLANQTFAQFKFIQNALLFNWADFNHVLNIPLLFFVRDPHPFLH
jgi:hypothetical protein